MVLNLNFSAYCLFAERQARGSAILRSEGRTKQSGEVDHGQDKYVRH